MLWIRFSIVLCMYLGWIPVAPVCQYEPSYFVWYRMRYSKARGNDAIVWDTFHCTKIVSLFSAVAVKSSGGPGFTVQQKKMGVYMKKKKTNCLLFIIPFWKWLKVKFCQFVPAKFCILKLKKIKSCDWRYWGSVEIVYSHKYLPVLSIFSSGQSYHLEIKKFWFDFISTL